MQEVWTICRIFRRSVTYKKQPQLVAGNVAAAAAAQPDTSSNTGSLESDTGDEYMNSRTPPQVPMNNNDICNVYDSYQFQGQWNNGVAQPVSAVPQHSSTAMASGFHQGVHSSQQIAPDDLYFKDTCSWDEIGRMVMELTDPSGLYDCTFA